MSDVKMVLVIRKDLKMRRGKEIAQACHGAVGAILRNILDIKDHGCESDIRLVVDQPTLAWIQGTFTKITVVVNSEQELLNVQTKCNELGIRNTLIEDNGYTEFHNEKTKTVLAIGPDYSEKIDKVTGNLVLY